MQKEKKDNMKCVRLTDEVLRIIESCKGNNFGQKFENLVYDYKITITEREMYLKSLDENISQRKKCLQELSREIDKGSRLSSSINSLLKQLETAIKD